ncbi:MAG: T9SS type B sorting domain-containing protein [Flavobacterium sp.]|uniref:T9SS type B sorting domain-containing protein n=1 Tax=Flavobacterium sp. TaxID=239 RepID=UPI00120AF948|nr:choice-of-anchor L domain-containing protein [Flavobacterium sp.]RZJ65779.1 MAG: T9SS type B sorting domain-containing protein [Flavobacterium sp.]
MKKILALCLFAVFASANAQYITVDENFTSDQLVNDVLINNPCATAQNIAITSWNFGSGNSFGYFESNGSGFPFNNGIVLTTGRAASAIGPNTSILSEGPTGWSGDADLAAALGVSNTINATVLEFDFIPLSNRFSFDYIFSSEQYLSNPSQNQCGYTDGFAFLIKKVGSGLPYENLAVLPGSGTPVSVNTVRGPGTICPVANPAYFDAFNGSQHPTNYNGQTKVMTAYGNVDPNQLYHIKLVIADQGNNLYDSAIFLGGGSFNLNKDFGPDLLVSNGLALCDGSTQLLDATEAGASNYQWFENNSPIPGETNPTYLVDHAGDYRVEFQLSPSCIAFGEIKIEYITPPAINNNVTLVQCDPENNGSTVFNLLHALPLIANGNPDLTSATFFTSLAPGSAPINDPINYQSGGSAQIYAVLTGTSCPLSAVVNLVISNTSASDRTITLCAPASGSTTIDLSTQVTPVVTQGLPSGLVVNYYTTVNNALAENGQFPNLYDVSGPSQTFYARIVNGPDCYAIIKVTITLEVFDPGFEDETLFICDGASATLSVPGGFSSYSWSNGDVDNETVVTAAGTYSVTVTNANGCEAIKQFDVQNTTPPGFLDAQVNEFDGNGNSITIVYSGTGDYEFSIDGQFFQSSPVFNNVAAGDYTIFIRDTSGCYVDGPHLVSVSDFPRFFTPNGDGIHDVWLPKLSASQIGSRVLIFDRYGKLLKTVDAATGWDGMLNSAQLPSSDYWFVLELQDGRRIKGHFSLKR